MLFRSPNAAVSSDFIVGFCSETDEEFAMTVDLLRECRFKNSFIFKYSERAGTKAAERMPDDVPYQVKQVRNNELLEIQNAISLEDNQRFVGTAVEVLVEGPSKVQEKKDSEGSSVQLTGRTPCDRIVVFDGTMQQVGRILPVVIYDVTPHTLFGAAGESEMMEQPLPQVSEIAKAF